MNEVCPCCGRHCPMDDLHCSTGKEYAQTDVVKEKKHHKHHAEKYEALDIHSKLAMNLREISRTMNHRSEGKGSQKRVLTLLNEHDGMSQKRLTERLDIQSASVSEVLAKLENAGLITKEQAEDDRRTMNVKLTEEGKREAQAAQSERAQKYEEMFSCLDEEEKQQLVMLLEKINHDWRHRYPKKHHEKGHHGHRTEKSS